MRHIDRKLPASCKRIVRRFCVAAMLAAGALLAGCGSQPPLADSLVRIANLKAGDLESQGIAFITPSTITGQEQDKQAVALIFTNTFAQERSGERLVGQEGRSRGAHHP